MGVWDDGASESRLVIERIEADASRASGLTSIWSFVTRALGKQTQEAKQMTAASAAGAASHDTVDWHAIDWPKAHALVRRLQARIGATGG